MQKVLFIQVFCYIAGIFLFAGGSRDAATLPAEIMPDTGLLAVRTEVEESFFEYSQTIYLRHSNGAEEKIKIPQKNILSFFTLPEGSYTIERFISQNRDGDYPHRDRNDGNPFIGERLVIEEGGVTIFPYIPYYYKKRSHTSDEPPENKNEYEFSRAGHTHNNERTLFGIVDKDVEASIVAHFANLPDSHMWRYMPLFPENGSALAGAAELSPPAEFEWNFAVPGEGTLWIIDITPREYGDPALQLPGIEERSEKISDKILDWSQSGYEHAEQFRIDNATRDKILNTLQETAARADENDSIIVYFSGHLTADIKGRPFIMASNSSPEALGSTAIPLRNIDKILADTAAKSMLLLDSGWDGPWREGREALFSVSDETIKDSVSCGLLAISAEQPRRINDQCIPDVFTHTLPDTGQWFDEPRFLSKFNERDTRAISTFPDRAPELLSEKQDRLNEIERLIEEKQYESVLSLINQEESRELFGWEYISTFNDAFIEYFRKSVIRPFDQEPELISDPVEIIRLDADIELDGERTDWVEQMVHRVIHSASSNTHLYGAADIIYLHAFRNDENLYFRMETRLEPSERDFFLYGIRLTKVNRSADIIFESETDLKGGLARINGRTLSSWGYSAAKRCIEWKIPLETLANLDEFQIEAYVMGKRAEKPLPVQDRIQMNALLSN